MRPFSILDSKLEQFMSFKKDYGLFTALKYMLPSKPNVYYKIRDWFFPYNVVKVKTLPKSWCDRDELMYHAVFQILVDFVEKECKGTLKIYDLEEERKSIHTRCGTEFIEGQLKFYKESNDINDEMMKLYNWWKNERPLRETKDPLNRIFEAPEYIFNESEPEGCFTLEYKFKSEELKTEYYQCAKEHSKFVADCAKEDEEMFQKVIKTRKYLWT